MAPTKPTHVNVDDLKQVVSNLMDLQDHLGKPPPESFDSISGDLESDLKSGDKGLQGNAASVAGTRYKDAVTNFTYAWGDVKTGISSMITLLNTTIAQHSGADTNASTNATSTNTTQAPNGAAGKV